VLAIESGMCINFPEGSKKGFVDENGNEVIPYIYYDKKPFPVERLKCRRTKIENGSISTPTVK
jgi:hypothetical protein